MVSNGLTGAIAGEVRDSTGGLLPGVTVEAASPALIEKVRTVATDGQGQYKSWTYDPVTYSVTFTLPGFSGVKREDIGLTSGFTARVDAELRLGSVSETVTVSGASPVVDVQNVQTQSVFLAMRLMHSRRSRRTSGWPRLQWVLKAAFKTWVEPKAMRTVGSPLMAAKLAMAMPIGMA